MTTQPVLRILHLTDENRGGSQRHLIDLCRSTAPGVAHYVLRAGDRTLSLHDAARDRVLFLDAPLAGNSLAATLAAIVAELGIGCIHAHALGPLLKVAEAPPPALAAVPLCVTLHDLSCIDPRLFAQPGPVPHADPAWIARCAPILRAAAAVIVPSPYLAHEVAASYPELRPEVIANGIAPAPAAELPLSPPWPADQPSFAVVGALGLHKGSDTLLRVAAALEGSPIVGVILGYTEAQSEPGWAVPGRLYVHGRYTSDALPGLLAAYRVQLAYFPNVIPESFSYALSEVWQAGVPALAPAGGALGERVRDGGGWVLEDPRDSAAAATEIRRLLGPHGAAEVVAASAAVAAGGDRIPSLSAMRERVEAIYRAHGLPSTCDTDRGWVRLRYLAPPGQLTGADDIALDAEYPALVREARALREWNGKLVGDVDHLETNARSLQSSLDTSGERLLALDRDIERLKSRNVSIEADAAALKMRNAQLEHDHSGLTAVQHAELLARNGRLEADVRELKDWSQHLESDIEQLNRRSVRLEADIVAVTGRNLELETDVVALKERNTLVEADLFAIAQRNARIEKDAAGLQAELAAAHERLARSAQELAAAAPSQRVLQRLPAAVQHWLLRHAG